MIAQLQKRREWNFAALLTLMAAFLSIFPVNTVLAASKPVVKAKYAKGILSLAGKGPPKATLWFYDSSSDDLIASLEIPGKGKFRLDMPRSGAPCVLRTETQGKTLATKVLGVKGCGKPIVCQITDPVGLKAIRQGDSVPFKGTAKGNNLQFSWSFTDSAEPLAGAVASKAFAHSGLYRATLTAQDAKGQTCSDAVMISVAPNSQAPGKVAEQPAPTGSAADADKTHVVLPFEEMGMMCGSQLNLPYNALTPLTSLNALVYLKDAKKPAVVADAELYYSATSNDNDPMGAGSINSTSQNYFADGSAGANYATSVPDPILVQDKTGSQIDSETITHPVQLLPGKNYREATIKKTEFWDKIHNSRDIGSGIAQIQNEFKAVNTVGDPNAAHTATTTYVKALAKPDQGFRSDLDSGEGMRAMPGVDGPYARNDPQKILASRSALGIAVAQQIPVTDVDDQGRLNPYPLMRVQAKVNGETKATTDAVVTASSEFHCRECHAKGGIAAEDVVRTPVTASDNEAKGNPTAGGANGYSPGSDPSKVYPPALHNTFQYEVQFTDKSQPTEKRTLVENGSVRSDRAEMISTVGEPLKLKLKFFDAESEDWRDQEKAALLNAELMHDYMVFYTPTSDLSKPLSDRGVSTQLVDYFEDKWTSKAQPMYFCAGHHATTSMAEVGIGGHSGGSSRPDYGRTMHGFHARLQVDGNGKLIRDERGHPKMWGGRGWDPEHMDDKQKQDDGAGNADGVRVAYDPAVNNWAPETYPMDSAARPLFPVGENIPNEENCLKCHAGRTEKCYRDEHFAAGLKCEACHSDMPAMGDLYPRPGKNVGEIHAFREPWLDEPNCGSCHDGGDPGGKKLVARTAFAAADKSGTSKTPADPRFSVMSLTEEIAEKGPMTAGGTDFYANKTLWCFGTHDCEHGGASHGKIADPLYRKSRDVHGNVPCAACHGGSHAIWPNPEPNANDNVTAVQLQGYEGTIMECSVCHTKTGFEDGKLATDGKDPENPSKPVGGVAQGIRYLGAPLVGPNPATNAFMAGPHGMHPVNDPSWYDRQDGEGKNNTDGGWHALFAKQRGPNGEDQCEACHSKDHKTPNRLSKVPVDRQFKDSVDKKTYVVKAGEVANCSGICHSQKVSFKGTPFKPK